MAAMVFIFYFNQEPLIGAATMHVELVHRNSTWVVDPQVSGMGLRISFI